MTLYVHGVPDEVTAQELANAFQEWADASSWLALDVKQYPPRERVGG